MRVLYIADDGTEFDDSWDCEDYEWRQNHKALNSITFLDENNNVLNDPMSDETYNSAETIIVPTDEAAKELRELGEYAGWFYDSITSAGVWMFTGDSYNPQYWKKDDKN